MDMTWYLLWLQMKHEDKWTDNALVLFIHGPKPIIVAADTETAKCLPFVVKMESVSNRVTTTLTWSNSISTSSLQIPQVFSVSSIITLLCVFIFVFKVLTFLVCLCKVYAIFCCRFVVLRDWGCAVPLTKPRR
jgi:hypothetical protein